MSRLARIVPVLAALLCGVLAGRVLWSPMPDDPVRASSRLPDVLSVNGVGVAGAAVVAVLVTVALTRRRSLTLVTTTAVAGLLLLALPELLAYPDDPAVLLYSNAVAAGMVLGAISPLAARERDAQAALAAGAIGAFLLSGAFVALRRFGTADFGWTAYSGYTPLTTAESTDQPGVVGLWPAAVAAVLVVLTALLDRRTSWTARVDTPWLAATAALPVAAFVAAWILVESGARPEWWYPYAGLATVLVAWIAWHLPGRDGQVVFAGAAVLAAATGGTWSGGDWWSLAVPAGLIVVGVVVGLRWPVPAAGFGLLALVAAGAIVDLDRSDLPQIAAMFVLPVAAGYVVGSCLPASAPASTVGLSLPFTIGVPGIAAVAWTITERYADYASASPQPIAVSVPAGVVALAVIVLCGVGAWGLELRSGAQSTH
ncbi:Tat pathway signal sequence domain protein [Prescottella defluvii]|uniref:hypothetical protein n=1 Tax=Prescottella defluvii TaxID=1323361 RepID=UPI0004F3E97C|nr:hypothetical protein [Prescottella defluvii]